MEIAKSIFREYDIRGIYPEEINENVIKQIAKAISIKCLKNNVSEICIGRDGRLSGENLLNSLSDSLSKCGINVVNIGLVSTPLLYFAAKKNKYKSGVMITGSHNPKNYNGVKLIINDSPVSGNEIFKLIDEDKPCVKQTGKIIYKDIKKEYIQEVRENININNLDKFHKLWIDIYKPAHKLDAPKCSRCYRFYWEIEKYLYEKNIQSKDIFYQKYNPQKGVGNLVCKICDPYAFKLN